MSVRRNHITGWDLYRSPEFRALCDLLGVWWEGPTRTLTIRIDEDKVTITQEYLGSQPRAEEAVVAVDTTSLQNEKFRTSAVAKLPPTDF